MTTQYKIVTSDIEPEEHNLWLKWTDKLNPIPKIFMYLDGDWKPLNISREDLAELEADLSLRIDLFSDQFMEHITRLNSRITSNYEFIARIENTLNTQVATLNESIGRVQRNLDIEKIRLDGRIDTVERAYQAMDKVLDNRITSNTNLFNGLSTRITNEIKEVTRIFKSDDQGIYSKIEQKSDEIYKKITSVQVSLEESKVTKNDDIAITGIIDPRTDCYPSVNIVSSGINLSYINQDHQTASYVNITSSDILFSAFQELGYGDGKLVHVIQNLVTRIEALEQRLNI